MPRKRKSENLGLPRRWTYQHKAYYFRVPRGHEPAWDNKKMFRLGSTLYEAHQEFGKRLGEMATRSDKMQAVIDRYTHEVVPKKKHSTQRSNLFSIPRIRSVFGEMRIGNIESHHIFEYRDRVTTENGAISANRDLEVISHIFTKSIEWGYLKNDQHPTRGLRIKNKQVPRTRYVTDEELALALSVASPFLKCYICLRGFLGLRKGDMLRLERRIVSADCAKIAIAKKSPAGQPEHYKYVQVTPALKEALQNVIALNRKFQSSDYLFCTRAGKPYISEDGKTSGFDSIWQRYMKKVVALGVERFTEHDLRAKVGSDEDSDVEAQDILDHESVSTTKRVYRRKPEIKQPSKGFFKSNDTEEDL